MDLAWNWLSLPWFACAAALLASGLAAVLVRGDRVLRIGSVGASMATLPWAVCSALAACTDDTQTATQLLRLGNGPVALVGPGLLLVLLGVSGQLERHRWVARVAGVVGTVLCTLCWLTPWTVSGVHRLSSGVLYPDPSPLSGVHFSQIGIWLAIGLVIARRSVLGGGERKRLVQMLFGVLALGAVGMLDLLVVYDIAGSYPVAWLPAMIAALVATYYELRSDLLRPQGFDRGAAMEGLGFLVMVGAVAVIAFALPGATPLAYAAIAGIVWLLVIVGMWIVRPRDPSPVARERGLGELVSVLADVEHEAGIVARVATLWRELGVELRSMAAVEGGALVDVVTGARRPLDAEVGAWLGARGELLAAGDLGTMRLGTMRAKLEALLVPAGAGHTALLVPLLDRGTLVGLIEADRAGTLREDERGLVTESARAVARALTYVGLTRAAGLERETAREVEIAEAMRLQAAASRDDELGRWRVAAEYRTAAHTTGAGWSATLLADGRLAVLVTEAQAHGVAAALATAALTGAFAAATTTARPLALDDLLGSLRASAEGAVRGGEPVATFVALLDAERGTLAWATAGHPGGAVLGAASGDAPLVLLGDAGTRGELAFGPEALLVVASSAVRGTDAARWELGVRDRATAGLRLAQLLVDQAARAGAPDEDLLAIVVRQRALR